MKAPAALVLRAVDTIISYAPINLGVRSPGVHTIDLPYSSDWAIEAHVPPSVPVLPMGGVAALGLLLGVRS